MEKSRKLLNDYAVHRDAPLTPVENARMWEAKRIVDSAVNRATGEIIPAIGRMCAFVPVAVPITLGMLTMTSTASILGLQWLNQSYNALFNYSHRSKPESNKNEILAAYGIATATSCALALSLNRFASRIRPAFLLPTLAVMTAGCTNVGFTRGNEMREGIKVFDEKGRVVGTSKKAGMFAVGYTMLSRSILLPIPIMIIPGLLSELIKKQILKSGFRANRKLDLGISLGCIVLSQATALPMCIALFPTILKVRKSELEEDIASATPYEYVYINKGI